jgi:uncharacterized Zn finger protein
MRCSCPDSAGLCKHLAAVLYGVGNRLDNSPELLFTLRNVDHLELVSQAVAEGNLERSLEAGDDSSLAGSDLGEMFGIDIEQGAAVPKKAARAKKPTVEKPGATKIATKKKPSKTVAKPKAATAKTSLANGRKRAKAAVADAGMRRKPR